MSAFVVGYDHIDGLLTWAIDQKVSYYWNNQRTEITRENASKIGRILLKENERSVGHRYPDCKDDPTEMPGTCGQEAADYIYRRFEAPLTAVSIIKACDCLDYQSCEHDEWEQSEAWRIMYTIHKFAGRRTAGYDNAPGWELRRPTPVVAAGRTSAAEKKQLPLSLRRLQRMKPPTRGAAQ